MGGQALWNESPLPFETARPRSSPFTDVSRVLNLPSFLRFVVEPGLRSAACVDFSDSAPRRSVTGASPE